MTSHETRRPAGTQARPGREAAVALAILFALVAAPNALGLVARLCSAALGRFWAWWPPASLEPLPLGVAALVMLVTAYALATRGSRRRAPGLSPSRRFLPPLDLLLLQLGNVTFLAFALILAVVTLGLLSSALRSLVGQPWLVGHSLVASLAVAAAAALLGLRRPPAAGSSPGAPQRRWSRQAALLGGAGAALWLIGAAPARALPAIRLAESPLDRSTLAGLYALLWIVLLAGLILERRGRSESAGLRSGGAVGSLMAWIAWLGFLTLYLDGALLTLRGHLAGP